jgi:hypothetical protein
MRVRLVPHALHHDDVMDAGAAGERFVGVMGAEPSLRALESGADVVIAGRSSDTAIFAGLPMKYGFPAGLAWHAAKILECGAAAVVNRKTPDCITASTSTTW